MTDLDKAAATLKDLYRVYRENHNVKHALSRGNLVAEPPPGYEHGRVASNLVFALQCYARERRDGVVLTCDTWFVLARYPDTVRGPDVAYVKKERCADIVDEIKPVSGPPDLAVEVLSPGNTKKDVASKIEDFLTNGTPLVWIVDPKTRTVRAHSRDGSAHFTIDDTLTAADVLPGFALPVREVFTS